MILSKEITECDCKVFVHPWSETCAKGLYNVFLSSLVGSAKFCGALAVLQIAAKNKNLTKEKIVNILKYNANLLFCGVSFASIFFASICLQRNICGKFDYHTVLSIPGFLSGGAIFVLPSNKRHLFVSAMWCSALETALNATRNRSIFRRTILFMIFNSLFMYYLRLWKISKKNQTTPELWFFSPHSSVAEENHRADKKPLKIKSRRPCDCIQSCMKSIIKEASKYFWYGAILEVARIIITNIKTFVHNPRNIRKFLLKKSNLKLAVFAGLYVFLHKVTICALCRFQEKNKPSNTLIAGFVAGAAFYIRPNVSINITVLVNLVHVVWKYYNVNEIVMRNFPTNEFLFMVICGFLAHMRVFDGENTAKFFTNMISIATNGRADEALDVFSKLLIKTNHIPDGVN